MCLPNKKKNIGKRKAVSGTRKERSRTSMERESL